MAKNASAARPALRLVEIPKGDAKQAATKAGGKSKNYVMLPIESIKEYPGFNVRLVEGPDFEADLHRLKDSINDGGFWPTNPLSVLASLDAGGEDVIYVTKGHRRLRAARLAVAEGTEGLDFLPCIFEASDMDMETLNAQIDVESATVRKLLPLERAVIVKRMRREKHSVEEIASKLGITPRYVNDLELLIDSPKEIRELVATGKVAAAEAVKKLRKNAETAVEELQARVDRATERGRTSSSPGDDGPQRPKVKLFKTSFSVDGVEGDEVSAENVEAIAHFFPDGDWYAKTRSKKRFKLTETIKCVVTTWRAAKPEEEGAAAEEGAAEGATEDPPADPPAAEEQPPAPRKAGRKGSRKAAAAAAEAEMSDEDRAALQQFERQVDGVRRTDTDTGGL